MARRSSKTPPALPRALEWLIEAAEGSQKGTDVRLAGDLLRSFGTLAIVTIATRGVFVPNDDDVIAVIERVAAERLPLRQARRSFHKAISRVEPFEERDAIESAHLHVRTLSDTAYFYAGVAFGVTFTSRG